MSVASSIAAASRRRTKRRSPWRFLREDWGLLLLSALLTLSVWNAVRDEVIITKDVPDVPIKADHSPHANYKLLIPEDAKVSVTLACSKPKYAELATILLREGIRLRVGRGVTSGPERNIELKSRGSVGAADADMYILPFPEEYLASRDASTIEVPEGTKVIDIQPTPLPIEKPTMATPPPGTQASGWSLETVRVDPNLWNRPQPSGLVARSGSQILAALEPDPIPYEVLAEFELDKEYVVELSFNRWEYDDVYRPHADIPSPGTVKATVIKRSKVEERLTNELWIGLDSRAYTVSLDDVGTLQEMGFSAEDGRRLIHAKTRFTGRLQGSREMLDRFKSDKALWCWELVINPSELPAPESDGEVIIAKVRPVLRVPVRGKTPVFAPANGEAETVQIAVAPKQ